MSDMTIYQHLQQQLNDMRTAGLYKTERILESAQGAEISVDGRKVLNFCANNYLGLANHPAIIAAADEGLKKFGYGMASVRFICGTQSAHKQLESAIAKFLGKEDAILYSSCWDANGGIFETILTEHDAIISDELNHASIIDGIRLAKATRRRYKHNDLGDLEQGLKETASSRFRLIVTDGVFSMDGDLAKLPEICNLAERHKALVMVDDSHATGFLGPNGRGSAEELGCLDRIDVITSTLGKTLGGAVGGFTAAKREIVEYLRNRSRPYLFSNSLPPSVCFAAMKALEMAGQSNELRNRLHDNAKYLRQGLESAGFTLKPGRHPILPVMLGEATLAVQMAVNLLKRGIYVIGFSYPVVPHGQARIRIQLSAAHNREQLDQALGAFTAVGRELGVVK
jgi:glycine C-acetyltransferase